MQIQEATERFEENKNDVNHMVWPQQPPDVNTV